MSVIVVVRNNGFQYIFNGPITNKKLNKIKEACSLGLRKNPVWSGEAIEYVKNNYRVLPASLIAENLTAMHKKQFTKSMVIAKWHRINNE